MSWYEDFAEEENVQRDFLRVGTHGSKLPFNGRVQTLPYQAEYRELFEELGYTWERQGNELVIKSPESVGGACERFDLCVREVRMRAGHLIDYHILITELKHGTDIIGQFEKRWPYKGDPGFERYAKNLRVLSAYMRQKTVKCAAVVEQRLPAAVISRPTESGLDETWLCVVSLPSWDANLDEDWVCGDYGFSSLPFEGGFEPCKKTFAHLHQHICVKCGLRYEHEHFIGDSFEREGLVSFTLKTAALMQKACLSTSIKLFIGSSHVQFAGQCPNQHCEWYSKKNFRSVQVSTVDLRRYLIGKLIENSNGQSKVYGSVVVQAHPRHNVESVGAAEKKTEEKVCGR